MKELIERLCWCTGHSLERLKVRNRKQELTTARYIVMSELVKLGLTTEKAGEIFARDHTTVIHGNKTISNIKETKSPLWAYNLIQKFEALKRAKMHQESDIDILLEHNDIYDRFKDRLTVNEIKFIMDYGANCVRDINRQRDRNVASIPSCQ